MERRKVNIRPYVQINDDVKFLCDVSGNSGCKVEVYESDVRTFVRKTSSNVDYNVRMKAQVEKLIKIRSNEVVTAPQIYNVAYNKDGLFFYDMEFIRGKSFASFILSAPWNSISNVFDKILGFIDDCMSSRGKPTTLLCVGNKIASLAHLGVVSDDLYEYLLKNNFGYVNETFSHGDLSFENIIVDQDENVYLIDALNSYIPNYFCDISKLLTELLGNWSYINSRIDINPTAYASLLHKLKAHPVYNDFRQYDKLLTIVDLLRTVPYLKDEKKIALVYKKIEDIRNE